VQCIKGAERDIKSADPAPRNLVRGSIQLKSGICSTLEMSNENGRDSTSVFTREFSLSDLAGQSREELHFPKVTQRDPGCFLQESLNTTADRLRKIVWDEDACVGVNQ